jgi:archaellum component FlaC
MQSQIEKLEEELKIRTQEVSVLTKELETIQGQYSIQIDKLEARIKQLEIVIEKKKKYKFHKNLDFFNYKIKHSF